MIFIFCLFAVVLVYYSFKSWRGGVNYLDFFRTELAKPESDFAPFVSIFVPCRGIDSGLEENLLALFRQNFPAYEILFVVDSETDKAVSVIKKIFNRRDAETRRKTFEKNEPLRFDNFASPRFCDENAAACRLVIGGKAENEGQKVHNLREAVLHAADESQIFVFVDSDARPNGNWLKTLIAPLKDEKIGCATGYRWFVSDAGNPASELRAVWNASIASALGANLRGNFCWGGSMAMRRETFDKIEMREHWRGVLSDDFAVTRRLKDCNLPVYFVPQALTASIEDCNWREFFEFTTRQMKITRVYAAHLWKASLLGAVLFNLVMIWAIFILMFNSLSSFAFWFALIALALVIILSVGKSYLRLQAVRLVLSGYERHLRRQFWTQNTLWIFTPAVFFYNCLSAAFSRRIVWRGIVYKLVSAHETLILKRDTTKKC